MSSIILSDAGFRSYVTVILDLVSPDGNPRLVRVLLFRADRADYLHVCDSLEALIWNVVILDRLEVVRAIYAWASIVVRTKSLA